MRSVEGAKALLGIKHFSKYGNRRMMSRENVGLLSGPGTLVTVWKRMRY